MLIAKPSPVAISVPSGEYRSADTALVVEDSVEDNVRVAMSMILMPVSVPTATTAPSREKSIDSTR
jgi:hypothetical protein